MYVEDTIDALTSAEEEKLMSLFQKVYDKSGMPIALYVSDSEWKEKYVDLKTYAKNLYYNVGVDENSMVIVFSKNKIGESYEWKYDMYCGSETDKCLSSVSSSKLLENLEKAMPQKNVVNALDVAWNSIMNSLAKTTFSDSILTVPMLLVVYGAFYVVVLGNAKRKDPYRYI
jgi:hypothetical protein